MSAIIMNIPGIAGESQMNGFAGQIEAVGLSEIIQMVSPQFSGSGGGVGRSQHSDIGLTRFKDKASPKLAEACSSGANLGAVTVSVFRTLETGPVVYMVYTLEQTLVSRIEHETLEESGSAFLPHIGNPRGPTPTGSSSGSPSRGGPASASGVGPTRQPVIPTPFSKHTSREVERVWLNANQIVWTYTPYTHGMAGGSVSKTFSIERSVAV